MFRFVSSCKRSQSIVSKPGVNVPLTSLCILLILDTYQVDHKVKRHHFKRTVEKNCSMMMELHRAILDSDSRYYIYCNVQPNLTLLLPDYLLKWNLNAVIIILSSSYHHGNITSINVALLEDLWTGRIPIKCLDFRHSILNFSRLTVIS